MADKKAKETIVVTCESCAARVAGTVEGSYVEYVDEPGFAVRHSLLKCPKCGEPILVWQDDEDARYAQDGEDVDRWSNAKQIYPVENARQLGTSVPDPIRKAFAEALSCFREAKAYTASAIMCRKVLEGVCDSYSAKGGNLASRLKNLADAGKLDKGLYEWSTTVRMAGNEAAHDVSVTVSQEDASDLLDLAEAVAVYLFTFKEKFENFKKRREKQAAKEIDPSAISLE